MTLPPPAGCRVCGNEPRAAGLCRPCYDRGRRNEKNWSFIIGGPVSTVRICKSLSASLATLACIAAGVSPAFIPISSCCFGVNCTPAFRCKAACPGLRERGSMSWSS
jgi:hypothetical protein